jgi:protein-tyrosine phosphatase
MRVLFVCLGNICRSPTAEGVLRHQLQAAGLADRCRWRLPAPATGMSARRQTAAPARRRWRVVTTCRAARPAGQGGALRRIRPDPGHGRQQPARPARPAPVGKGELDLFLRRYGAALDEVPDPYYGGADGFEQVLDLIEAACQALVLEIKGRL